MAPEGGLYEGSFWMSCSMSLLRVLTSFSLYRTSRVFSLWCNTAGCKQAAMIKLLAACTVPSQPDGTPA